MISFFSSRLLSGIDIGLAMDGSRGSPAWGSHLHERQISLAPLGIAGVARISSSSSFQELDPFSSSYSYSLSLSLSFSPFDSSMGLERNSPYIFPSVGPPAVHAVMTIYTCRGEGERERERNFYVYMDLLVLSLFFHISLSLSFFRRYENNIYIHI